MGPTSSTLAPVTITIDLEDHRPSPSWEARYPAMMRRLLDHLDGLAVRGTVFVVGEVARRSPALVREVAERGHEVGLHSWRHVQLTEERPAAFRAGVVAARSLLQDLTGQPVGGFRAPTGSLVPSTLWATEVLAEEGFRYSASVLPARSYKVGFPGCPARPFRWPSGLVEVPCPALRLAGAGMPFLGGTFLRVLPLALVRGLRRRLDPDGLAWTYIHPYDLDVDERFWVVPEVRRWGSVLVWWNRAHALERLDAVVGPAIGAPLADRLDERGVDLPTWSPPAPAGSAVTPAP